VAQERHLSFVIAPFCRLCFSDGKLLPSLKQSFAIAGAIICHRWGNHFPSLRHNRKDGTLTAPMLCPDVVRAVFLCGGYCFLCGDLGLLMLWVQCLGVAEYGGACGQGVA